MKIVTEEEYRLIQKGKKYKEAKAKQQESKKKLKQMNVDLRKLLASFKKDQHECPQESIS